MSNPIIVALDLPCRESALKLAETLMPTLSFFKVGKELFTTAGPEVIRDLRRMGASVFLDLKFHDIPNTVARAVVAAARLDVQMMTLHTSGGLEMMAAAQKAAVDIAKDLDREPPLLLGVTVLTSLSGNDLAEVGQDTNVGHQVERLAQLAVKAGLRGLVCSPLELAGLRPMLPENMKLVTPGIRPASSKADDQKRTLTPKEALKAGASWLVIGRPITAAANPREAADAIVASL